MKSLLRRSLASLRHQGWWVLVASALIGGALWGFVELADEVADDETHAFDRAVMLAFRESHDPDEPWGPGWVEDVARDITSLGGVTVLLLLCLAVVGFLMLRRKWSTAIFVAGSVSGGTLRVSVHRSMSHRRRMRDQCFR